MYRIDELVTIFTGHAAKSAENQIKLRRQYWESNPGEPYPEHLSDEFNLPLALSHMCIEIDELKEELRRLKIKQNI